MLYHASQGIELYHGDCLQVLKELPAESVHCVVTSPPYWGLRDYGTDGQLGLEETPEQHVAKMVEVFSEVRRVLRTDGTLWLNYGDCYANSSSGGGGAVDVRTDGRKTTPGDKVRGRVKGRNTLAPGLKQKDLCGIPWRVAFALQGDGWWLRQDIIWHKPNPMPESVTDRCTKAHEYIFLLTKAARYHYDADSIREDYKDERQGNPGKYKRGGNGNPYLSHRGSLSSDSLPTELGRNRRSVWTIATAPYPGAHFATFPPKLIEPCIMAGCPEGGTVLDPFLGSGTTGAVAQKNGCKFIGIELNEEYLQLAVKRFTQKVLF